MGTGALAGSMLVPEELCCCIASMSVCADITCWPEAAAAKTHNVAISRRGNIALNKA
jgi:hypothetical protein